MRRRHRVEFLGSLDMTREEVRTESIATDTLPDRRLHQLIEGIRGRDLGLECGLSNSQVRL